jgi:hypothetical protein
VPLCTAYPWASSYPSGTRPPFIKLWQNRPVFKWSSLLKSPLLILSSREYAQIRWNTEWCSVSGKHFFFFLQRVGGPLSFACSYGSCIPGMRGSHRLWNCPCKSHMQGSALYGWYNQFRQNGRLLITGHVALRAMQRDTHTHTHSLNKSSRIDWNLIPCLKWVRRLLRGTTAPDSCYDAVRPAEPRGRRSRGPRAEEGPTRATRHIPQVSTPRLRTVTVHIDLSSPFRTASLVTSDTSNRDARHHLSQIHSPTSLAFRTKKRREAYC